MENPDQSDNESQPLVQPRNTYRQFLASAFELITIPLRIPVSAPVPQSTDETSPSTPILPGSYPSERSKSVKSAVIGNIPLEHGLPPSARTPVAEQVLASASQAIEELRLYGMSGNQFEEPAVQQVITSAPQAREKLAALSDQPEGHDGRDVRRREAGDEGDPGISITSTPPSHVPLSILEVPFINRGNGNPLSREVGGEVIPDITTTIANETSTVTNFQGASNFQISNTNITAIGGDATIFQFGRGQFTEDQRKLICDHIATFAALPDINDKLKKHVLTQMVILLPRAEAVFNDYQNKKKSGPCFEGTRVALLREMANWVTGQDESRMYILSGLAGIGKSTVAYTIAARAADLNLLGASFFFSRDEADRNNAKKLFTTIAYQLCVYDERFAKVIGDVLLTERGSAATTKDPQEQLEALILNPLRSIAGSYARPILVVIDALDECCEDDVCAVVEGLSQLVRNLPSFKVILTTRPQPYDYFLGNQGGHKLFHLQDIESRVVDGDIRLYLKHNLSLKNVRRCFRRREWHASDDQIDVLVRAAGRLFIIASTAVRYILDKSASNPAAQMEDLLRACGEDYTPFQDLDHFYTIILRNVIPLNCQNKKIICRYQSIVGAIIFVSYPLPVSTLAHLIDIDVEDIYAVLEKLQSVILLGDDHVPQIYHKSFPDYLTNQERCNDSRLRMTPRIHHTQIATCCFNITNQHLRYNILDLGNVARYMSNEDGLKKDRITDVQLQEKIPRQLHYACVYWVNHLKEANIEDTDLMNGLAKFVDKHTLHWFEVLSLIGNLDRAHHAIFIVLNLVKSTSSHFHQLLSDALRFISKFYDIIKRSALHTYYSALPFSPTDSFLYRRYIKEAENHILCVVEGGLKKWDAFVASLNHGGGVAAVNDIKFSFDSVLFVSWSREGPQLRIWDATTGIPISTIPGHRFAFNDDVSTIVSSEDNVITYYNKDGSTKSTRITTSSKVEKLALSGSSRIAAVLLDGTVWLWESTGELIDSFDGFEVNNWPESRLQFSSADRLAYSSTNGIVKLWNGISGRFIADLQCGSSYNFEFSYDGSRIASLSRRGLSLWNSESGWLVGAARPHVGAVRPVGHGVVAISANGSLLATADSENVTLWSENRDHLVEIEVLSECKLTPLSMAFLLDNTLAIQTAPCLRLYNTNTHSFVFTLSAFGDQSVAISPDYTRIACQKSNDLIYLLDMQGFGNSDPPSNEKKAPVVAIALSRDCSRLACGTEDDTVELWETSPAKRRMASYKEDITSTVEFGHDGRLFASGFIDRSPRIKLRNSGDGSLYGTLEVPLPVLGLALSTNVLVSVGSDVRLWSLDTLSPIHTFNEISSSTNTTVSISDDSDIVAIGISYNSIHLIDVMNRTTIATFSIAFSIRKLSFLPDKSRLIAQTESGDFLSLNLIDNSITNGSTLEHLIQLPNTPLWHGVPVWFCRANQYGPCVTALFPQHQTPVPVLWIPSDIIVNRWTQGPSMIALCCPDGRIILLRLPTSHVD